MTTTELEDYESDILTPDDPGFEARIQSGLSAMSPDVPLIRNPESGAITLLYGVEGSDGTRQTAAMVRELTGRDEEFLARLDNRRDNYYVLVEDLIVKQATMTIGDIDVQKNKAVLSKLLIADKGMLFMQIMYATYGTTKTYEEVKCGACQTMNDFDLYIPDIVITTPLKDPNDPTVVVTLRKGSKVLVRYPLVEDQMFVYGKDKLNRVEQNTLMIARTVEEMDGQPIINKHKFALDLLMPDREKIVNALHKGPGVTFKEVSVPCTSCEVPFEVLFGWADLL